MIDQAGDQVQKRDGGGVGITLDASIYCLQTWSNGEGEQDCMCDLELGHAGPHECCCGIGLDRDQAEPAAGWEPEPEQDHAPSNEAEAGAYAHEQWRMRYPEAER